MMKKEMAWQNSDQSECTLQTYEEVNDQESEGGLSL
jgi:hypothetical protein